MAMPQETTSEVQAEAQTGTVPANANERTITVVEFSQVREELVRLKAQAAAIVEQIGNIENVLAGVTIDAVIRPDGKPEITGTPASSALLTKSGIIRPSDIMGKAINAGVLLSTKLAAANGNAEPLRVLGFLGDENGNLVRRHFNGAIKEITVLNGGVVYGTGTEQDNRRAIATGEFKKGTIILATFDALKEMAGSLELNGSDGRLRTDPNLKAMNDIIASGSNADSWGVSGRENAAYPSNVDHVRLKGGDYGWDYKGGYRSLVVLLQCG